ncbi:precorrin-6y C5,15-methyltransferase (decarboxylating) subunit CbiE [Frankia sp. Cj5]|uniref:precorrin-6y C5,15-methyltransferase (decarboxylating) subunit CbiE n=1 Tax=Frankia sp. Cj5 TaxID=2880978 RepID=UPI001EF6CA34|nr:precorrin-6y C5,15-methyltransferase (decarboxylating) subunit CbiE [Frankia sp. Cj5]
MAERDALWCTVVGVGADGWRGLSATARQAVGSADVVLGSSRQLRLLDDTVTARRVEWPSPLLPALPGLLDEHRHLRLAVLASGDPMFFGIGSALVSLLGPERVRVLPTLSSVSLACARLGWPVQDVEVVSVVGRPLATLHPAVQPGRRVLVLAAEPHLAGAVCALLVERGFGPSAVTVLTRLGGPDERVVSGVAQEWAGTDHDPLTIVAIECRAGAGAVLLARSPGLPDEAFEHDGQITKWEVRAMVLAALMPVPGRLLWDVGAGSGSVGIEWMRSHPACRAVAVEPREDRRSRISRNAEQLGVPALRVVAGRAPEALAGLPAPDAVFIGGGITEGGVVEACMAALAPGGRLVANAVTVESEATLAGWHAKVGGTLTRIGIQRAGPVGGFTGWRPAMPVTQWSWWEERG